MNNNFKNQLVHETNSITSKYGFKFTKSLGQNFLTDSTVLDDIAEKSGICKEDYVIEIGPGFGTLTKVLLEKAGGVCSIELDEKLIPILNEELKDYDNLKLINSDVLKTDLNELMHDKTNVKIVANLPYYITTPVIIKIINEVSNYESVTLMLQKEVVDRIKAHPSTKDYGAFTIFVQYYCDVEFIRYVPKTSFIPVPKVDSAVVKLIKRKKLPIDIYDEKLFFSLVRYSFNMRRKTLFNALRVMKISEDILKDALYKCNIDPKRRGETLSIVEFGELSNCIYELNK